MKNSILNINISYFANCESTTPKTITILEWLTSERYRQKVEILRSIQDESLQKVIKKALPAITPSGRFSYRAVKYLIEHSGFLAFDIDFADNKHISNFSDIREQISHIASVAYCGLSVRGKGFWGLVPIPKSTPEIHKQRFESLKKDFKEFNINLDPSGSDVCRLRIYSFDKDAYFNHSAITYTKLIAKSKPQETTFTRPIFSNTREKVETVITLIKESRIDITQSYKDEWLKLAAALANEFGELGRGYFHAISCFHGKYTLQATNKMFDQCLKHEYSQITIASFFKIAGDYGIKIKAGNTITQYNKNLTEQNIKTNSYTSKTNINTEVHCNERPITNEVLPKNVILPNQDSANTLNVLNTSKLTSVQAKLNTCLVIEDFSLFFKVSFNSIININNNLMYNRSLDSFLQVKKQIIKNLN